jgi:hypothetical protein
MGTYLNTKYTSGRALCWGVLAESYDIMALHRNLGVYNLARSRQGDNAIVGTLRRS